MDKPSPHYNIILRIDGLIKSMINPIDKPHKDVFSTSIEPKISIIKYLIRIQYYVNNWEESSMIKPCKIYNDPLCDTGIITIGVALIYIKRTGLLLDKYNIHRILLLSSLVANKFCQDDPVRNDFFARVGGISLKNINKLEKKFCEELKYNCKFSTEDIMDIFYEEEIIDHTISSPTTSSIGLPLSLKKIKPFKNYKQIFESEICGCFFCIRIYSKNEIVEWVDDGQTALCPYCEIDSVIGDKIMNINISNLKYINTDRFN